RPRAAGGRHRPAEFCRHSGFAGPSQSGTRESGFDAGHRGRADGDRRARAVALGNRQDAQPHAGDAAQVGGGPGAETRHRPLGPMTADAPPDAAASAPFCPPLARVRRQIRYATFGAQAARAARLCPCMTAYVRLWPPEPARAKQCFWRTRGLLSAIGQRLFWSPRTPREATVFFVFSRFGKFTTTGQRWLLRLDFVRRWPGYAAKFATRPLAHKRPEGRGCHGWIFGPGAVAERNIQSGVAPKEETMSKPFDATLKTLLEESPVDWPALAGHPEQTVEVIDADISTFTGATDKVLRVRGLPDWIMHFEFQSGPDATLPRRLHGYNALLEQRHDLLVRSVVVLLRRQADLANVTGVYERQFANEP